MSADARGPGDILTSETIVSSASKDSIVIVRHGEKQSVSGGNFGDAVLTQKGRAESKIFGSRLPPIGMFLTSNVARTIDTAVCIKDGNRSSAEIRSTDALSGMPHGNAVVPHGTRFADMYNLWSRGEISDVDLKVYKEYGTSVMTALLDITERTDGVLCIVTHNYIVAAMGTFFKPLETFDVPYLGGLVWSKDDIEGCLERFSRPS